MIAAFCKLNKDDLKSNIMINRSSYNNNKSDNLPIERAWKSSNYRWMFLWDHKIVWCDKTYFSSVLL